MPVMVHARRGGRGEGGPGRRGGLSRTGILLLLVAGGVALLLLGSGPGQAAVPTLSGRVNDYADLLSEAAERSLEAELADLERTDSTQIAVLTVPDLGGETLEAFSVRTAQQWGLGRQDKDNGALLLVARRERAVRIEVGYGLEWRLTDIVSGQIVDEVITPRFRQGRFDEGVAEGVRAMVSAVRGEYQADRRDRRGEEGGGFLGAAAALFFFASLFRFLPGPVRGVLGAVLLPVLGYLFSLGLLWLLLLAPLGFGLGLVAPLLFGGSGRPRGGMFGGGGFGGGGFGGGGFSGGGGGFGGGGASGRW